MKNIIFIGGIHGVGKTTFCQKVLQKINIQHYSASHLIKSIDKELIYNKNKKVIDIDNNQNKLIIAINKYIEETKTSLLDGHFCLLNRAYEIKEIPINTFIAMRPKAIIVLYDKIDNIKNKNSERDGILYNDKLLLSFQNRELGYSEKIAKKLDIPYKKINVNDNFKDALEFIKGFL